MQEEEEEEEEGRKRECKVFNLFKRYYKLSECSCFQSFPCTICHLDLFHIRNHGAGILSLYLWKLYGSVQLDPYMDYEKASPSLRY